MNNIYLIGFMGCGKTSIATCLERTYGIPRIEMDRDIEAECGMSVSEIFRTKGEPFFREKETQLLKKISIKEEIVISCGGGVPMDPENVEIMRASGKVVYLKASPETILSHVKRTNRRPLLEGRKTIEDIREMMDARRTYYESAADVTIVTDGRSVADVANEVKTLLT